MSQWHPINWRGMRPGETWGHPDPPVFTPALYWNRRQNMKHGANTYRVASYACENVGDCSHWMPYTEGMGMPSPPTDFAHFD